MSNFSIYFCNLTEDLCNRREILKPIKASLLYSQIYTSVDGTVFLANEIEGDVDNIIFEATIKDLIKLNNITQDNLEALNSKEKTDEEKKQEAIANLFKEIPM